MDKNDLTLCIIARNEAKGLRRAVESARETVREINIGVDIESTDDTLKIARELTPNVFLFRFKNDFAAARNDLAATVRTNYIFWLDGHEYIAKNIDFAETSNDDYDGYLIKHELENGIGQMQPHIIRKGVLYQGVVHEQAQLKKPKSINSGLVIHDRQQGQESEAAQQRSAQRDRMMIEIMEKDLKKNKKNTRALMHLGFFYHAKKDYKKALKFYGEYLKYSKDQSERFMIEYQAVACKMGERKFKEAIKMLEKALKENGEMWELNFAMCAAQSAIGNHEAAIKYIMRSMEINTQPQRYFPTKRKPALAWDIAATELYALAKYEEAAEAWGRAAELTNEEIERKLFNARRKLMCEMAAARTRQKN